MDYAKTYIIETNAEAKFLGRLDAKSQGLLQKYFKEAHYGPSSQLGTDYSSSKDRLDGNTLNKSLEDQTPNITLSLAPFPLRGSSSLASETGNASQAAEISAQVVTTSEVIANPITNIALSTAQIVVASAVGIVTSISAAAVATSTVMANLESKRQGRERLVMDRAKLDIELRAEADR